ncbi:hypothetical protein T4C_4247, partial [Trichinella pseudospiralis]
MQTIKWQDDSRFESQSLFWSFGVSEWKQNQMNVHCRIRLQYTRAWSDAHHSLLTSREWSIETDPQTWLKENIVCTWNFTVSHSDHRSWEKNCNKLNSNLTNTTIGAERKLL